MLWPFSEFGSAGRLFNPKPDIFRLNMKEVYSLWGDRIHDQESGNGEG
jgi:hypothetical protein